MVRLCPAALFVAVVAFAPSRAERTPPHIRDMRAGQLEEANSEQGKPKSGVIRALQYGASYSPQPAPWAYTSLNTLWCDWGSVVTSSSAAEESNSFFWIDVPDNCDVTFELSPVYPSLDADLDLLISIESDFAGYTPFVYSSSQGGNAMESVTVYGRDVAAAGQRFYVRVEAYRCPASTYDMCSFQLSVRGSASYSYLSPTPTPSASATATASGAWATWSPQPATSIYRIPQNAMEQLQCADAVSYGGVTSATVDATVTTGNTAWHWIDIPRGCDITVILAGVGTYASSTDVDLYVDPSSYRPVNSLYSSTAGSGSLDTTVIDSGAHSVHGTRWYIYVKGYNCPQGTCRYRVTVQAGCSAGSVACYTPWTPSPGPWQGTPTPVPISTTSASPVPYCVSCTQVMTSQFGMMLQVPAGSADTRLLSAPIPSGNVPFTFTVRLDTAAAVTIYNYGRRLQNLPSITTGDVQLLVTASNQPFDVPIPTSLLPYRQVYYGNVYYPSAGVVASSLNIGSIVFDYGNPLRATFLHGQVYMNVTLVVGTRYGMLSGLAVTAPLQLSVDGASFNGGNTNTVYTNSNSAGGIVAGVVIALLAVAIVITIRLKRRSAARKRAAAEAAAANPAAAAGPKPMPGAGSAPGMVLRQPQYPYGPGPSAPVAMYAAPPAAMPYAPYPPANGYPGYTLQMQQPPPQQAMPYTYGPTTVGGMPAPTLQLPPVPLSDDPVPSAPESCPSPTPGADSGISTGFGMYAQTPQPGQAVQPARVITMAVVPHCHACGRPNGIGVAWGCGANHASCSTCAVRSVRSEMAATRALWPVHCPECRAAGTLRVINTVAAAQVIHASRSSNDPSQPPFDASQAQTLIGSAQAAEVQNTKLPPGSAVI